MTVYGNGYGAAVSSCKTRAKSDYRLPDNKGIRKVRMLVLHCCNGLCNSPLPRATDIIIQINPQLVNLFYSQKHDFAEKFYAMPYSGEKISALFGHIHEVKVLKTLVETVQFSTIDFVQSHSVSPYSDILSKVPTGLGGVHA